MKIFNFKKLLSVKANILFAILFLSFISILFSQNLPYEEKAKYENFLAQKIEGVLVKLLGPNQAQVMVDIEMDFTKTEKVDYENKNENKQDFKMQNQSGDVTGIEYLMPGFGLPGTSEKGNQSYKRQLLFPTNFIKKMKVTVLVNKNLDENLTKDIRNVVSEIVQFKNERGDEISVVRANFAPIWKTIWYNPESMSFVLKYIVLAFLGIISMIIVAIGFLKIAGAMSTMAKVQQNHNITMDIASSNQNAAIEPLPLGELSFKGASNEKKEEKNISSEGRIIFNIMPHQIDALISLMLKEDPANVAIVVNHLSDELKEMFLKKLPMEFAAEVIASLSKTRFLEQDIIYTLKDELETRLSGAVGGMSETIKHFEKMDYYTRSLMLKNISVKHPDLVSDIRDKLLVYEDIYLLSDSELGILSGLTDMQDWANFIRISDSMFIERLKTQFSTTAWKIIEEKNKYEIPSEMKIAESINRIMEKMETLISEGRIIKPKVAKNEVASEINPKEEKLISKE